MLMYEESLQELSWSQPQILVAIMGHREKRLKETLQFESRGEMKSDRNVWGSEARMK